MFRTTANPDNGVMLSFSQMFWQRLWRMPWALYYKMSSWHSSEGENVRAWQVRVIKSRSRPRQSLTHYSFIFLSRLVCPQVVRMPRAIYYKVGFCCGSQGEALTQDACFVIKQLLLTTAALETLFQFLIFWQRLLRTPAALYYNMFILT